MSTRSIVGTPLDNGFRGRYIHSDGNPMHTGRALHTLTKRDGLGLARRTLVEEHFSWYVLFPERSDEELGEFAHGRDVVVSGYGVAYEGATADEWCDSRDPDGDLQWAYVLNDTAMSVLMRVDRFRKDRPPSWLHVGDLSYALDYDRDQLMVIECGERFERCTHMAWFHVDSLDRSDRRSMRVFLAEQPVWPPRPGNHKRREPWTRTLH